MDSQEFDSWAALAKADPAAFEARRQAAINAFIDAAPADQQQRLRGLQFRVDMERSRASNPLSATIRISRMMWGAFGDLREALDQAVNGAVVTADSRGADSVQRSSARIIPFAARPKP